MSLQTLVSDELLRRLHQPRDEHAAVAGPQAPFGVLLTGASMRLMEMSLALGALAVAILIGLPR